MKTAHKNTLRAVSLKVLSLYPQGENSQAQNQKEKAIAGLGSSPKRRL
jgi:hypothetical protein